MRRWLRLAGCAAAGIALALAATDERARDGGLAMRAAAQPVQQPAVPNGSPGAAGQQQWAELPEMLLEKMYRGPLRDTVIQRWRDPIDGSVCFLYIPISAPLQSPSPQGYVQYGPNQIGSISCVHPTQVLQLWQGGAPPPVPATHRPEEPAVRKTH